MIPHRSLSPIRGAQPRPTASLGCRVRRRALPPRALAVERRIEATVGTVAGEREAPRLAEDFLSAEPDGYERAVGLEKEGICLVRPSIEVREHHTVRSEAGIEMTVGIVPEQEEVGFTGGVKATAHARDDYGPIGANDDVATLGAADVRDHDAAVAKGLVE